MEYEVIYEIAKQPFPFNGIWLIVLSIILLLCSTCGIISIIKQRKVDVLDGLFCAVSLICAISIIIYAYGLFAKGNTSYLGTVSNAYNEGAYYVVEGSISNHEENYAFESFWVNDIKFRYKKDDWGAFIDSNDDIYSDGQMVRITYVQFDDDVTINIVKVEIMS